MFRVSSKSLRGNCATRRKTSSGDSQATLSLRCHNERQFLVTLAGKDVDHSIVADVLVRGGAKLIELREDEIGLEEVFMRVTRGETQ